MGMGGTVMCIQIFRVAPGWPKNGFRHKKFESHQLAARKLAFLFTMAGLGWHVGACGGAGGTTDTNAGWEA